MIKLEIGNRAPDLALQSNTGEKISLSQFLGKKKVVIFFYPMDESPVCSREAEAFKSKYETFKELGGRGIRHKLIKRGVSQVIFQTS